MSSRYDVPRAAPEPLRAVQLFVNSIDREHELDWLDEWFAEHGPVAEPERVPGRCVKHSGRSRSPTTACPSTPRPSRP